MANMQMPIGEYIHAKYNHYLWYGLNHYDPEISPTPPNPFAIFRVQRRFILAQANFSRINLSKQKIRQEVEEKLNFFWSTDGDYNFNTLASQFGISAEELRQEILNKIAITNFSSLNFNFTTNLGVDNLQSGGIKGFSNNLSTSVQWVQISAIIKRLNAAKKFSQEIKDNAGWAKWNAQLTSILKEWEQIVNTFKLDTAKNKMSISKIDANMPINNTLLSTTLNGPGGFLAQLNALIDEARVHSRRFLKGQVAELVPVVMGQLLKQKTYTTLSELLKDVENALKNATNSSLDIYQRGFESSTAVLDTQNFIVTGTFANRVTEINNQHYINGLCQDQLTIHPTQDKVDISIKLNNDETINASIKNYDLSNMGSKTFTNISLLKGQNPLYYLQEYGLFLNHYLNITAVTAERHFIQRRAMKKIDQSAKATPEEIYEANKMLIYSLAFKAMAGGVLKGIAQGKKIIDVRQSDMAELFIVNDNTGSRGHYKVYFLSDFIQLLFQNYNQLERYVSTNLPYSKIWYQHYEGEEPSYSAAYSRILKLLQKVSKYPISIEIPKSILEQFYRMT